MVITGKRVGRNSVAKWAALAVATILALSAGSAAGEDAGEKLDVIRRIISERGEYDLAERQLRSFVDEYRTTPPAAEALVLLGYCLDKQRKNNEAATAYSRVISDFPGAPAALQADASLGAADAWFRLGKYQDAIDNYSRVISLGGKPEQNEAALLWRGEAAYRLALEETDAGRDGQALLKQSAGDFTQFMDQYPDSKLLPSAISGAAFAHYDGEEYEPALALFQRFVAEFPSDRRVDECRYYSGESLYRLHRYDEAKVAFSDLLSSSPNNAYAADARAGIAWADYGLRQVREAAAGFEEAAKLAGDDKDLALSYLYDAGCAWREAGDAQKAAQPLLEVAKATSHELNGLAWLRLGTLWQEQARVARERAENAGSASERQRYSEMQKKMGGDSVQYFRRAIASGKLGDEEREAYALLGEVLLDAEQYADASKTFEEVAYRWPDSDRAPWALYHQALVERTLSRQETDAEKSQTHLRAAAAALRKALEYPDAKIRLQANWALAEYLVSLDETAEARERYRWLATEGQQWAKDWRNPAGRPDPALETRAADYAADSLFRLGESYYFTNDHPRAAGFYQEITGKFQNSPQSAMALLRLGEIAEAGRDTATAQKRYEEALQAGQRFGKARVGSTIGHAHLRLGTMLLRQGQRETDPAASRRQLQEALKQLQAVISDPPEGMNLGRPYYYLAETKYSLGLKRESLADYENSIKAEANGELADAAWFGLAWARRDLNDPSGALTASRKVVESFPDSQLRPDAYALMASIKRAEGDASGALSDLDRFLTEYPEHTLSAKAELERASALDETGKHAEAAALFQKFLTEHPDHPDVPQALYQRSWALWNQIRPKAQQAKEAETRWKELTGGRDLMELLETDRADAARAEDEMRALNADVRKAEDQILADLRDLTERYPNYPVVDAAWLRIGEILYDRGDYQLALSAYQRSLSLAEAGNSDLADKARYRLAWSIQRLGEESEKISLTDPDQQRRENARKDMWDKRVAAIDAFEGILGRYPRSPLVGDACFRAAELRRRSGQDSADATKRSAWFQSAIQRYRQAVEKSAADAPYRRAAEYGDGLCLLLDGKSAEAREVFRRLLLNPDGPYVQEAYWGLGQANLNLGAYADAASVFEQALVVDKTTETAAKSYYGLGMTAAMSGDREQARVHFLHVDLYYPQYPEWAAASLVRAARTALEENLRDKAIDDLERVLAKYPDTPSADEARDLQATVTAGG